MREIEKYSSQGDDVLVDKVGKFVGKLVNSTKNRN